LGCHGRWALALEHCRARRDAHACKKHGGALAAGVGFALLQALIVALF